jgi:hypothetical protein
MRLRTVFLAICATFLLAHGASAQQIRTDYDRSANFSQYKTFSWEKVETQDQLWVDRIKSAALTAKGWTEVESGGDVSIVAMEITHERQTLNTFYDNFGGGWRWGGFGGFGDATTTTDTYKVGTLVIDMFDSKTKNLLWRSSASDTLSSKSEKNIENLDKGVRKMFEHFPPQPKA